MPARAHRRSSQTPGKSHAGGPPVVPARRPRQLPSAPAGTPATPPAPDAKAAPPVEPPAASASTGTQRETRETSAGGLVVRMVDGAASAALIGRLDRTGRMRWSLPKGHIEPGETAQQAAVREVAEETGISGRITDRLGSLAYTFVADGRRIHKRVHHFLMVAECGELSDADAEVTAVAWVPIEQLRERLAYPAERRMARRAADLLAGTA